MPVMANGRKRGSCHVYVRGLSHISYFAIFFFRINQILADRMRKPPPWAWSSRLYTLRFLLPGVLPPNILRD